MIIQDIAQLNLTVAGTRQAVSAVALNVESAIFTAAPGNTGYVYIGSANVSSTRFVKALAAGESWSMAVNVSNQADSSFIDLSLVNWDGTTTNNKLNVGYMQANP